MDIKKDLELFNSDLLKLKNSIYNNNILEKATEQQEDVFNKMLISLIDRVHLYMKVFEKEEHVSETYNQLEKVQELISSEDIIFSVSSMKERLQWYREHETKENEGNFVASVDMVILWPLRVISESLYRNLFKMSFDNNLDDIFNEIKGEEE